MKKLFGSLTIGTKPEDKRKMTLMEIGDTVTLEKLSVGATIAVKAFTHVFQDEPEIQRGTIPMRTSGKYRYNFIYVGGSTTEDPLTEAQLEKRLNKLGWFRKTES